MSSNLAKKLFTGTGSKEITDRLPGFEIGNYVVEVKKLLAFETKMHGSALIGEFKVVESDNPGIRVGSERSWYRSMNGLSAGPSTDLLYQLAFACEGLDRSDLNQEEKTGASKAIEVKLVEWADDLYKGSKVRIRVEDEAGKGKHEGKTFQKFYFTAV